MKNYRNSKFNIQVTPMTLGLCIVGGALNFASNPVLKNLIEKLPENIRPMVSKFAAAGKTALGFYGAVGLKKVPMEVRAILLGLGIGAGIETAAQFLPDQVKLGVAGGADFFESLGNTQVIELPIRNRGLNSGGVGSSQDADSMDVYGMNQVNSDFFETI